MCGCDQRTVCGYHTQAIIDLIERLDEAERDGDDLAAAGLRPELNSYGRKVDTVRQQLTRQENR